MNLKQLLYVDEVESTVRPGQIPLVWIKDAQLLKGATIENPRSGNLNQNPVALQKNIQILDENITTLNEGLDTTDEKLQKIIDDLGASTDQTLIQTVSDNTLKIAQNILDIKTNKDNIEVEKERIDDIKTELGKPTPQSVIRQVHDDLYWIKQRIGNKKDEDINGTPAYGDVGSGLMYKTEVAIETAADTIRTVGTFETRLDTTNKNLSIEINRATDSESKIANNLENESERAKIVEESLQSQINVIGSTGGKGYRTFAAMDADKLNIPINTVSKVTNDPDVTKNGDWQWDGTTFSRSDYDPLTLSKGYTDTRIGELINSPPVNIFTKTNKITGSYITKAGVQTPSASWSCSGFLEVKYRDIIDYKASVNNVVSLLTAYDSSKTFIKTLVGTTNGAITELNGSIEIDKSTKYIRASYYTANPVVINHKPFELETDLLNDTEITNIVWDGITAKENLFDPTTAKSGFALVNNVETANTAWIVSDYIKVQPDGVYTSNGTGKLDTVTKTGIHYYDNNKVFLDYGIAQKAGEAFSVPNNVGYMRLNYVKSTSPDISDIVVNAGLTASKTGRLEAKIVEIAGAASNTKHRYSGLGLMTFGDSITDHWTTSFTYPPIVAKHFDMTLFDTAMSGSRIRSSFYFRQNISTTENVQKSNIMTIAHGTNDFRLETPLGTIDDAPTVIGSLMDATYNQAQNKTGTFYADYKGVIENIYRINPNARIMLICPLRRILTPGEGSNGIGLKLLDYVNAIKDIAKLYSLPVLDNFNTSGFNPITIPGWTSDGLHPTEWGQKNVLAQKIIGFIESN